MSFKAYCTDLGQGSAEIHRDCLSTPHSDAITSCIIVASHSLKLYWRTAWYVQQFAVVRCNSRKCQSSPLMQSYVKLRLVSISNHESHARHFPEHWLW
jgi:hypothetical protein